MTKTPTPNASLARSFLTTIVIVFVAEVVAMYVLSALPRDTSELIRAVADGLLLVVISAPLIWFFVARPYYHASIAASHQFENLLELAPEGILGVAPNGEIRFVNQQAQKLFGYSEDELVGSPVETLIPARFVGHHPELRQQFLGKPPRIRRMGSGVEVLGRRADGAEFPADISLSLVNTAGAESIVLAIIRDISLQKQAEIELREASRKLSVGMEQARKDAVDLQLLTELGGLLQSCVGEDEIYPVVSRYMTRLFPDHSGMLFISKTSENVIEPVSTWGEAGAAARGFTADSCWALRRSQIHVAAPGSCATNCLHVDAGENRQSVCVPLLVQGEAFGILHLLGQRQEGAVGAEDGALANDRQQHLFRAVSEQVALALANLRLRDALRSQSIRDPLTQLYNRRYLDEYLEREISRSARGKRPLSILMVDIDHFKRFNDTFGHDGGDAVLKEIGALLRKGARSGDIACRYGGEEFLEILSDTAIDAAVQVAERLRKEMEILQVQLGGRALGKITASFGIAEYPRHGSTSQALIKAADTALYRAKEEGRNRVLTALSNSEEFVDKDAAPLLSQTSLT